MTKKELFYQLACDVSDCHLCENMRVKPYSEKSEVLLNISQGTNAEEPFVNLWNLWQGNLDADIMVIGQDFGHIDHNAVDSEIETFKKEWRSGKYKNYTDTHLRDLFKYAFDIDINHENTPLFFTNMANCYRKNSTTGGIHSGWLPVCANKFMGRLIDIIEPKFIITLGRNTFEAMACIDGARLECTDYNNEVEKDTFETIIKHTYNLQIKGKQIPIFPVFHPGANSNINRNYDMQLRDWKRIAKEMDYYK